jgi:DnaK suppressor protein
MTTAAPMFDAERIVLTGERRLALEQIDALASSFDELVASTREVATDDEHDPEGHTVAFERQQVAALLESARTRLRDVDAALARIDEGTYGTCESCGDAIRPERISARPAARTCVACARRTR